MSARRRTFQRRGIAVGVLLVGVALLLWSPLRQMQREAMVRRTLGQLQEALEVYRADRGHYVETTPLSATELVEILGAAGCLQESVFNPYTTERYGTDPFAVDKIFFSARDRGHSYRLEALRPGSEDLLLAVGSPR